MSGSVVYFIRTYCWWRSRPGRSRSCLEKSERRSRAAFRRGSSRSTFASSSPVALLDRVERGERTLEHVVVEVFVRELRVGIDPRDDEDRHALFERPVDERVLLAQVEDVVLVDPGRHDQQRPL